MADRVAWKIPVTWEGFLALKSKVPIAGTSRPESDRALTEGSSGPGDAAVVVQRVVGRPHPQLRLAEHDVPGVANKGPTQIGDLAMITT